MRRGAVRRLLRAALAVGAGATALIMAGVAGLLLYARSLPPLDLSGVAERSLVVLDRHGTLLRPFVMADGRWRLPITAEDVDPRYLQMLLAYEDRRFFDHFGVDPLALLRALAQILRTGRIVSGGSTITMQVARLVEPRAERSVSAKLRQIVRAVQIEQKHSKNDILGLYLSLAPFGGNLEGSRAAALAYFGKEPKRLGVGEAALLVALPQSPEARRPDRFPEAAARARARVLDRALARHVIVAEEKNAAQAEAVPAVRRPFPMLAAHLAEAARAERPDEKRQILTLESRFQNTLESLARDRVLSIGPKISAAILVVDHATGEIRASVGGADYLVADRAGGIDLTRALRSPGSALKPFIYAMAFDSGLAHPETLLEDRPLRFGAYAPENFDDTFHGMVTARQALQNSLNLPVIDLLSALGPHRMLGRLRQAGANIVLPRDSTPGLAIGLGGVGVTLRDLVQLFAGLARGGEVLPLTYRARPPVPGVAIVEPAAAWYVADILLGAPAPLLAQQNKIAYKTGTSYGYRDAWAIGFDKRHTIGVWVGRADNAAVPGLVGRLVAAPILFEAFARIGLETGLPPKPEGAFLSMTSALPPPLRHLRQDVPKTLAAVATPALRLVFPPDGARIDTGAGLVDGRPEVTIKVQGGVPPFTYLVNGAPIAAAGPRRQMRFSPDGLGFTRLSVVDATGATDSVAVRLQ